MLVVSETYQNYQNGALSNRLTINERTIKTSIPKGRQREGRGVENTNMTETDYIQSINSVKHQ
jgi:hypothetical protein